MQNFVERAVLMTDGPVLRPRLGEVTGSAPKPPRNEERTLAELERDYITETLE